jgi:hypothetical protein
MVEEFELKSPDVRWTRDEDEAEVEKVPQMSD